MVYYISIPIVHYWPSIRQIRQSEMQYKNVNDLRNLNYCSAISEHTQLHEQKAYYTWIHAVCCLYLHLPCRSRILRLYSTRFVLDFLY